MGTLACASTTNPSPCGQGALIGGGGGYLLGYMLGILLQYYVVVCSAVLYGMIVVL